MINDHRGAFTEAMSRILALDYGQERIGLAVSDQSRVIAQTLEPVIKNNPAALSKVQSVIKKYQITEILVGLPVGLSGSEGRAAAAARDFAQRLQARTNLPVELIDERLTTRQARGIMQTAGFGQDRKRDLVDNLAAQLLLQAYLDRHARPQLQT